MSQLVLSEENWIEKPSVAEATFENAETVTERYMVTSSPVPVKTPEIPNVAVELLLVDI